MECPCSTSTNYRNYLESLVNKALSTVTTGKVAVIKVRDIELMHKNYFGSFPERPCILRAVAIIREQATIGGFIVRSRRRRIVIRPLAHVRMETITELMPKWRMALRSLVARDSVINIDEALDSLPLGDLINVDRESLRQVATLLISLVLEDMGYEASTKGDVLRIRRLRSSNGCGLGSLLPLLKLSIDDAKQRLGPRCLKRLILLKHIIET